MSPLTLCPSTPRTCRPVSGVIRPRALHGEAKAARIAARICASDLGHLARIVPQLSLKEAACQVARASCEVPADDLVHIYLG